MNCRLLHLFIALICCIFVMQYCLVDSTLLEPSEIEELCQENDDETLIYKLVSSNISSETNTAEYDPSVICNQTNDLHSRFLEIDTPPPEQFSFTY